MLRHQLGQHFVLDLDLLLQILDPFLLGRVVGSRLGLKGGGSVLKELLLPAVEYRRLEPLSSHSLEIGSCSSRCRLRMATFSSAV